MVRTPSCDKNGLKKGTWTAEEDRKLTAYVTRYGCWNWRQLPKFAGLSRCGKSCRLRWMNYLRPNIKRGNYSKEEEDTIIKLHESMGNRWSVIAAQLPGRTDNEIKNHWHTNLKKRERQNSSISNEEKHNTNNLAPREKRQKRLKLQPNNCLANQITSQIIDSSPSSSPQPSSSGSSSISKDTAVATSTEAYEETSGNFWTEPFLTDYSFVSSDFLLEQPFMNTEYLSPVLFDEFFCPYGLYEEKLNSNNLSQIIIDSSPSSPQLSSSEFSSITRDTAAATSTNMAADDNVTSSEAYAEISGDFWPQPFSADNSYIPNDFLEPFMETEYLSPVFDEFMCLYGLDGEHEGFN